MGKYRLVILENLPQLGSLSDASSPLDSGFVFYVGISHGGGCVSVTRSHPIMRHVVLILIPWLWRPLPHCRKVSFSLGEKKWPQGDILRPHQAPVPLRVSLSGFGVLFICISHLRSEISSAVAVCLHRYGPCVFNQFLPLEERPPL